MRIKIINCNNNSVFSHTMCMFMFTANFKTKLSPLNNQLSKWIWNLLVTEINFNFLSSRSVCYKYYVEFIWYVIMIIFISLNLIIWAVLFYTIYRVLYFEAIEIYISKQEALAHTVYVSLFWYQTLYTRLQADTLCLNQIKPIISRLVESLSPTGRPGQRPARGPHAARQAPECCPRTFFKLFNSIFGSIKMLLKMHLFRNWTSKNLFSLKSQFK